MDPNNLTPEDIAKLDAMSRRASVDLKVLVGVQDEELHAAAQRIGSYTPAVAESIRLLLVADSVRGDMLPTTPGAILEALKNPVLAFGKFATVSEIPFEIAKRLGQDVPTIIRKDEGVARGFNIMRDALLALVGVALRGLRDGERAGWWNVSPTGDEYGVSETIITPEPSEVRALNFDAPEFEEDQQAASELLRLRNAINPNASGTNGSVVVDAVITMLTDEFPDLTVAIPRSSVERPSEALQRLADCILKSIDGEPSRSEGAVDTALRVLRDRGVIS